MTSPRHGGARRFNISVTKTAAGALLFGAAAFIVFGGMGASAPIFVICPIHALPIQNSDELKKPRFIPS